MVGGGARFGCRRFLVTGTIRSILISLSIYNIDLEVIRSSTTVQAVLVRDRVTVDGIALPSIYSSKDGNASKDRIESDDTELNPSLSYNFVRDYMVTEVPHTREC